MIPENLLKNLSGLENDVMLLRRILKQAGMRLPDAIDQALPSIFESIRPKKTVFASGNESTALPGILGLFGARGLPLDNGGRMGRSASVTVNVINNTSSAVNVSERRSGDGTAIDIIIDQMVAQSLSRPGSQSGRILNAIFGLSPSLSRR